MNDEMWSQENSTLEFRQGFREGIAFSMDIVQELINAMLKDGKINQAAWVEVAKDWLDDEMSMYEVGDEE